MGKKFLEEHKNGNENDRKERHKYCIKRRKNTQIDKNLTQNDKNLTQNDKNLTRNDKCTTQNDKNLTKKKIL